MIPTAADRKPNPGKYCNPFPLPRPTERSQLWGSIDRNPEPTSLRQCTPVSLSLLLIYSMLITIGEKEIQVNQQGIASASGNATTTLPASDVGGRTEHANQQQPEGQFNKQIRKSHLSSKERISFS